MPERGYLSPLAVQRLVGPDQTLVLLVMATELASGQPVPTSEVGELYDTLRIPRPANLASNLGRLRERRLAVRLGNAWVATPEGMARRLALVGDAEVSTPITRSPGPDFLGEVHRPVPFDLAPDAWRRGIARLLMGGPWDRNIMLITRYPTTDDDPVSAAIEAARAVAAHHDLRLLVASDRKAEDTLSGNVGAYMWAAHYGVALLEDRLGTGLNGNVLIELGAMLMTGRRCAVLKDTTAPKKLPSDILDRLYDPIDLDDIASVSSALHRWIAVDLDLGACRICPEGTK